MLRSLNEIVGYQVSATDGAMGKVKDFYFDDLAWVVRYLVVDTGHWLAGRKVLLSPAAVGDLHWTERIVPTTFTQQQVENSPPISEDIPVSRQLEIELADVYGWEQWWTTAMRSPARLPLLAPPRPTPRQPESGEDWDPNLRSLREVVNYRIQAVDGDLGHLEDVIVETRDWSIRYLVADTRNWLAGKKVLLDLGWIARLDWRGREVRVGLTREQIEHSPEFLPGAPVNQVLEQQLFDYYGRPC